MYRSWNNMFFLGDVDDDDLREVLRSPWLTIWIVKQALLKKGRKPTGITSREFATYTSALHKTMMIEIARRDIAYDRAKLRYFEKLQIVDLIEPRELPEQELLRAYTMRLRERTGKEVTVEELDEVNLTL